MRYIANTKMNNSKIRRLMAYKSKDGVYLFEYTSIKDGSAPYDNWFESLELAFEHCKGKYRVTHSDWEQIPDPKDDCQHDWIQPVRIVGRSSGKPQWGQFEKLVGNKWVRITSE